MNLRCLALDLAFLASGIVWAAGSDSQVEPDCMVVKPFDGAHLDQAGEVSLPDHIVKQIRHLEDMRDEIFLVDSGTVELQVPSRTLYRILRMLCLDVSRNFDFINSELAELSEEEALEFVRAVDYLNIPLLAERYGQATSYASIPQKVKDTLPEIASGIEIQSMSKKHRGLIRVLVQAGEPFEEINRAMQEPIEESRSLTASRKARYRNHFRCAGVDVDEKLLDASQQNNLEDISFCLFAGANPDYQACSGNTALIWSSKAGSHDAALELLKSKADPNIVSSYGDSALYASASNGSARLVRTLLDNKADPSLPGIYSEPPLSAALRRGHDKVAELLIEGGAAVNASGVGNAPLFWAVLNGKGKIVDKLLEKGAKTDVTNSLGDSPLRLARRMMFKEVEDSLVRHGATE